MQTQSSSNQATESLQRFQKQTLQRILVGLSICQKTWNLTILQGRITNKGILRQFETNTHLFRIKNALS